MKDNQGNYINLKVKIVMGIFIAMLVIVVTVISPTIMFFISLTTIVASVISYFVIRFFDTEGDEEEETTEDVKDILDLEGIPLTTALAIPYVFVSADNKVLTCNDKFSEIFGIKTKDESIIALFPGYDENKDFQTLKIGESTYDVYKTENEYENRQKSAYSLCFIDVSDREKLRSTYENERIVSGLIYIDNYDSVTESMSDFHLSILKAKINQRIGDYVEEHGGIIKKFEKDRYVYITSVKSLNEIKEKKFDILNEIKDITIKDHMPLTLSIGIGLSENSLEDGMKNARDAIDLALGRGGDQVVIKDGEKYLFYGGKSGEIAHNARIRSRVKAEALQMMIANANEVLVMGHKIPDFDSIGASVGVYRIATGLGKKCNIVMDEPSMAIKTVYDSIKGNPKYQGLFITGKEALEFINDKTLLVIVDTYVSYLVDNEDVLKSAKDVVVFDHHRKSTEYIEKAVLTYHEPYASSACELVTEVIRHIDELVEIEAFEADVLLAGIAVDTKNFGVKTGAVTFEAAAYLRRHGADTTRVKLLFQNELESIKEKAKTIDRVEVYKGDVAVSICEYEKDGANIIASQAADELLNVLGIKAATIVYKMNDVVYVSARSYGDMNVQLLLEKIGGGGHQTMAGAKLTEATVDEAVKAIKVAIDEYLEEEN